MKTIIGVVIVAVFSLLCQGCYYDKKEILYPDENKCDTSMVTYSLTVSPIISKYCLACHGNNYYKGLGANLSLEGYSNARHTVNYGLLLKSIQHEAGVSPMPKNLPQLSACEISKIKKWIDTGAPNN